MEKVELSPGIFWVDIPEADLYILCGCPADSVKHLMKNGYIVPRVKNGVHYETGPNAILLSDASIQNGSFANLAEFPVLHMFYKQGMLLPKHPNNTGVKPLLIGAQGQVEAQSKYIFRGNYGLSSIEEITAAGISEDQAKEMMRLKLRFAFDKVKNTEDLIECRIVDKDVVELRNGVFVHRKMFNQYEFLYQGKSISVDLNLPKSTKYVPAYCLEYHNIRREYFSVIHTGEGDGWDPNRPCMASIVSFQGKIYLIDAGPNIATTLTALGISTNEVEGLFHTHCHDDHFAGLTSLIRSDHVIKYFATPLVRASVTKKLCSLLSISEDKFARYFEIYDLQADVWNSIDGLEVKPVYSPHPVETSILFFRVLWENGYKSYAHLADIASLRVLNQMVTDDPAKSGVSKEYVEKTKAIMLEPTDLKKIDIGGGLIHGEAQDFKEDTSAKILLSHTSVPLTDAEKEIGSNADFGIEDILIHSQQDYSMQAAYNYLRQYFPTVRVHEIRMLLNCSTLQFNVGDIIMKKDCRYDHVYLLLNGTIEAIDAQAGIHSMLCSGSFIGEFSALTSEKITETYRAASFVRVLDIPCDLYSKFIRMNSLYDEWMRVYENRKFLQSTWLFGEMLSSMVQNRIARSMKKASFCKGDHIQQESGADLFLVVNGSVDVFSEERFIDSIRSRDFFCEEQIIVGTVGLFNFHASDETEVYTVPGDMLKDIPIIQWKLLEVFEKRMRNFGMHFIFEWRNAYSVNVKALDEQHKTLFALMHDIYVMVEQGRPEEMMEEKRKELNRYLEFHFSEEEKLMERLAYPDYGFQKQEHIRMLEELQEFVDVDTAFVEYLKGWILVHTLVEDRKYRSFFNSQGVV